MKKRNTLQPGDRIAYAAKFLRNTGQFTGSAGQRRGTFRAYDDRFAPGFARVTWDDFEANAADYALQYGEDYVDDARANGQLILAVNIAKVGSPAFASNDI